MADIEQMNDEEELFNLMRKTQDAEEKKRIRARLRTVQDAKAEEMERRRREHEKAREDAIKARHAKAAEAKQKQIEDMKKDAKEKLLSTKVGAGEQAIRDRQIKADAEKQQKLEQLEKMSSIKKDIYQKGTIGSAAAAAGASGGKPNLLGAPGGGGRGVAVQRSPSAIKEMLLKWCQMMTKEYKDYGVDITNFSSSWNNGMAFCALIHHFYPKAFDFSKLNPKNRRFNFSLAFDCAEKMGGIAPLLEVDDMVRMKNPDWKCVFTYVQSYYRRFRDEPTNAQ